MKMTPLLLTLITSFLVGCASQPPASSKSSKLSNPPAKSSLIDSAPTEEQEVSLLYQSWEGVPYEFGGATKQGIDCSAFMQVAMSSVYQLHLPRSTELQSKEGEYVPESQATFGDLVFFKTGWNQRHVGLYLGDNEFMHASSSKGVIISRLDNPYWASKFWQFRRVTPNS
ncbi:C40 family peptidase [Vibrio rumoiensis]|uniref:Hydrolase n=1 Tax=Vibrio rumoiensis 1S-45 TaxID=1188252 RepID=A0A1E5E6M8_9VIBR|nr:NlpC/P60 family protein [Vibrio rumoiensis]OEF30163.1 hydrolase [Vibrio rumoiensis 1S-45]